MSNQTSITFLPTSHFNTFNWPHGIHELYNGQTWLRILNFCDCSNHQFYAWVYQSVYLVYQSACIFLAIHIAFTCLAYLPVTLVSLSVIIGLYVSHGSLNFSPPSRGQVCHLFCSLELEPLMC